MTISAQIKQRAAEIKAQRAAGVTPPKDKPTIGERVLTWQDNSLRSMSNFLDTAEAMEEARRQDGVRPIHISVMDFIL